MLANDGKLDAEVTRAEELVEEQEERVWSVTVLYDRKMGIKFYRIMNDDRLLVVLIATCIVVMMLPVARTGY